MSPLAKFALDRRQAGFSILELMVALGILAVITVQMFVALTAQQRAYRGESRTLDLQETTRGVLDMITFDTRNAGMLVPRQAAVASNDGGTTGPDRFCVSDGTYFPLPAPGVKDAFWDKLDHRFNGAQASMVGTTAVTVDSLDIDGRGSANDFTVGSGIILADQDGQRTHCSRVTAIAGNQLTLAHAPPASLVNLIAPSSAAPGIAVPAIVYELNGALLRNSMPMSNLIEDLQIEYWVDNAAPAPNGKVDSGEWPISDLNGVAFGTANTARIRRVRISVLGRSGIADETRTVAKSWYRRPDVANHAGAATQDPFQRQLFTASILPRNLLTSGAPAAPAVP